MLQIAPYKAELLPIAQDGDGVVPARLQEVLKSRKASGLVMPKLMYLNPTGANPTGTVMTNQRRREIYRIACEYNFLILDDDPYHFMYFTKVSAWENLCIQKFCFHSYMTANTYMGQKFSTKKLLLADVSTKTKNFYFLEE